MANDLDDIFSNTLGGTGGGSSSPSAEELAEKGIRAFGAQDYKTAIPLIQKAAEMGNADAQCSLGMIYLKGDGGLTQDDREAGKWIGKAAGQGHKTALKILDMFQSKDSSSPAPQPQSSSSSSSPSANDLNDQGVRTGKAKEHFDQAEGNRKNKAYEKAIAEYGEVIKLLPNDAESYYSRGGCYSFLEQEEKAIADISKAISLEPQNGKYYNSRGLMYITLGETEKAIADVEKAVELAGTDETQIADYYCGLGRFIAKLTGDKRTAAVYYKKSVEHGDVYGMAQEALAEWGM